MKAKALAAFAALTAFLLLRPLGIHSDENVYLFFSRASPLGDSAATGKFPLFYVFNWLLDHSLGLLLGPWRPLTLYLAYAVLLAAALAFFSQRGGGGGAKSWRCLAALVLSPFFLFNGTAVMTETLQLALHAVLAAALLRGTGKPAWAAAFAAALVKPTSLPALLAQGGLSKRLLFLGSAAAAGFAVAAAGNAAAGFPASSAGGLGVLSERGAERMTELGPQLAAWGFFMAPVSLPALLLPASRAEALRACGWSLLGMLGAQLAAQEMLARYSYPALAVGLLGCARALCGSARATAAALLLSAVFVADAWRPADARLSLWPDLVAGEAYRSGFTVLPGAPLHGWVAVSPGSRRDLCVLVSREDSEKTDHIEQYFSHAGKARFFGDAAAWEACPGAKAVALRRYQREPAACPPCPGGPYRFDDCTVQPMETWSRRKAPLTNRTCLP